MREILLLLLLLTPAAAQKAQPLRITPPAMGRTTLISGRLSGSQQMQYVVHVNVGKQASVTIAARPRSLDVEIYSSTGEKVKTTTNSPQCWNFQATTAGDYQISVIRVTPRKGVTPYRLKFRVE